jgi:SAM-dependent methyltransferase
VKRKDLAGASFKDRFSDRAAEYARFRPRYPTDLFEYLASLPPRRKLAWDCGTGNGQAAVGLAAHFERVTGTDASPEQIEHAEQHPRVTYQVGRETASGLAEGSVDLVTVAQAVHWLDVEAFYQEARRVLRPEGGIAVWCYALARVTPEIDRLLGRFCYQTVGAYWAPERRHVETGYRDLPFPFHELTFPPFRMEHQLTLEAFAGFLDTWSAVRRYRAEVGEDPLAPFIAELEPVWGGRAVPRVVRWPLTGRAGRLLAPASGPARRPP